MDAVEKKLVTDKVASINHDSTSEDADGKTGTAEDRADMLRMGKVQELRRNFRFVSIWAFSMILVASWECSLVAPTTGGQYHWVSEFSPRKYQKFLSYLMGWLCVLGWQGGCASSSFMAGTMIQGLIALNRPGTYVPEAWHGTLLTIAVAAFAVFFNTFLARHLPIIESGLLAIHFLAFIGILATLWAMSPHISGATVFTQFNDGGGWNSLGVSTLAGITSGILPLLGADAAAHMSEELQSASKTIPRSMILTTAVNGLLGWIMIITFAFCVGPDVEDILATPTGYPFMAVFLNSTKSTASATTMSIFILLMLVSSNLSIVATASRQLFAFARDEGLPFSAWFARVSRNELPMNAIVVTFVTSALLSLINIGSATALNSITSLSTNALLSSYICSIGCMIWRRWTGAPLLPSHFSLGRWGLALNIASIAFLISAFVFAFFPMSPKPSADVMNWNVLIYGVVVVGSVLYYFLKGRHRYVGPVEYVRKLD
ncbi:putative gaba-specific permease [Diaporthe ampelina]|uniref:Putative gaba-specific permease n=1 Tax=Diaporthe ampelina TaxID=1214573 RepID=A0A0G2FV48_9PEZI|nr:putative gaba-specific permease [Diaporthe ampelina]